MSARNAYISVKQRNLRELNNMVTELDRSPAIEADKFRDACRSASSMLDRIANSDDASWETLQPGVDSAFREAYDRLHRIRGGYQLEENGFGDRLVA